MPDEHIVNWNFVSQDWECPAATNHLKVEGRFNYKFASKDGLTSFDFTGQYTEIIKNELISYRLDDNRLVTVTFEVMGGGVKIVEEFQPEEVNPHELQKSGWQAILENCIKYTEGENYTESLSD